MKKHIFNRNKQDNDDIIFISDDDTSSKSKKEVIINRVMIIGGVCIALFTIFYICVFTGVFDKKATSENETAATPQVEATEEKFTGKQFEKFRSTYSDSNIDKDVKSAIDKAKVSDSTTVGIAKADNILNAAVTATCDNSMSNYEIIKNIYDYVIYFFDDSQENTIVKDEVNELFGGVCYKSDYDAELAYRGYKAINDLKGSSVDYAALYTLMLKKVGFDAYYVKSDSSAASGVKGYTVLVVDNEQYIFDPEAEEKNFKEDTPEYKYFCININDADSEYKESDITTARDKFMSFAADSSFKIETMISNRSTSVFGNVSYTNKLTDDCNISKAQGNIAVAVGDTVNLATTLSGESTSNTWKLVAKKLDENGNALEENTVYEDTTNSKYNEASYTANETGNFELDYFVTDSTGKTCTITVEFEVTSYYKETTQQQYTDDNDDDNNDEEYTRGYEENVASDGELGE